MIEDRDLRAAIQQGLLTEAQAAGLVALADARRLARDRVGPEEEPFVLFKGFNEIFIVIGLSILFGGWLLASAMLGAGLWSSEGAEGLASVLVTLAGLYAVQRYFTLVRRMIAPSIALAVMTAFTAWGLGSVLANLVGSNSESFVWLVVAAVMVVHYRLFRVPFDAALIACSGFAAALAALASRGVVPDDAMGLLHLSSSGPLAALSLTFGLACFALAMRFDMSDPHRISTRSTTGFWLHVMAAPAIVNTLAIRLLEMGPGGQMMLLLLLFFLALVAIVIDRRSFLVSGAGYAVWLIFNLFDGSALLILALGLGLVLLGAQWDKLRAFLMRSLPAFPGKNRLPPYGSIT